MPVHLSIPVLHHNHQTSFVSPPTILLSLTAFFADMIYEQPLMSGGLEWNAETDQRVDSFSPGRATAPYS